MKDEPAAASIPVVFLVAITVIHYPNPNAFPQQNSYDFPIKNPWVVGVDPAVIEEPRGVAAGDLDGDGDIDLATGNNDGRRPPGEIWAGKVVYIDNDFNTGRFYPPAVLAADGTNLDPVGIGDMNLDGKNDIVAAAVGSEDLFAKIGIFLNDFPNHPRFRPLSKFSILDQRDLEVPTLVLADFNNDNKLDVAVGTITPFGNPVGKVGVIINRTGLPPNNTLSFDPPQILGTANGVSPAYIDVADINSDGELDIVHGSGSGGAPGNPGFFPGNGDGTFGAAVVIRCKNAQGVVVDYGFRRVYGVAAVDFNGDGFIDLACVEDHELIIGDDFTASMFKNLGGGFFLIPSPDVTQFTILERPDTIAAGDFDQDGDFDLVVQILDGAVSKIYTYRNNGFNGSFTFGNVQSFAFNTGGAHGQRRVIATDVDGDTRCDLVVSNLNADTVTVLHNRNITPYHRGDCNDDGFIDTADIALINSYLRQEGPPSTCMESMDANDDGVIDFIDSSFLATFAFEGGEPPPPPGPPWYSGSMTMEPCGTAHGLNTPGQFLGCLGYTSCP